MSDIWVVGTAESVREPLVRQLKREGYSIRSLCLEASGFQSLDPSMFQVAVFIIHPESPTDWIIYQDFKRFLPDCLLLIYMPHHPTDSLTSLLRQSMTRYAQLLKRRIRDRIGKTEAKGMRLSLQANVPKDSAGLGLC